VGQQRRDRGRSRVHVGLGLGYLGHDGTLLLVDLLELPGHLGELSLNLGEFLGDLPEPSEGVRYRLRRHGHIPVGGGGSFGELDEFGTAYTPSAPATATAAATQWLFP